MTWWSFHSQCMDIHLRFLGFLLQDGALYMPTKRASEVWDTLISNPEACDVDREVCVILYLCIPADSRRAFLKFWTRYMYM